MGDAPLRERMGLRAREVAREHGWAQMAAQRMTRSSTSRTRPASTASFVFSKLSEWAGVPVREPSSS
ncbi:hypothetical protein F0U60_15205 [Archangium minus]|uniref:Uncharacterized protein n=1 Tax=Archangium minus TaxID=83450 RepID=A0ABY9WNX7_9BACT|nr:hypothetical protein F0U60_15205 [Archangium minus]